MLGRAMEGAMLPTQIQCPLVQLVGVDLQLVQVESAPGLHDPEEDAELDDPSAELVLVLVRNELDCPLPDFRFPKEFPRGLGCSRGPPAALQRFKLVCHP